MKPALAFLLRPGAEITLETVVIRKLVNLKVFIEYYSFCTFVTGDVGIIVSKSMRTIVGIPACI